MAFFRFLIYSNVFVALCAAALTLGAYGLMGSEVNYYLGLHVFGVTLVAYNMQRLLRLNKFTDPTRQIAWYRSNYKLLITLLAVGALIAGLTLLKLDIYLLLRFAPLALLSFFYAVAFIPAERGKLAIRDLPYAKIIIIALVWTGVTWVLPHADMGAPVDGLFWWTAVQRFLFILAITIPFDARDLKYDDLRLKTIPQVMGYSGAKRLAIALMILCALIELLTSVATTGLLDAPLLRFAFYSSLTYVLARQSEKSPDIYFTGLLDGSMLLLGIILLIF